MGEETSVVEGANDEGSLDDLENSLRDAATGTAGAEEGKTTTSTDDRPGWIDEKFWNGNAEESATKQHESYKNLQSAYGRMANDLGTQRQLTDRLLDVSQKRDNDLSQNTPEFVTIEGADLLDNPNDTLASFIEPRLAKSNEVRDQRMDALENMLQQQNFNVQHPDAEEIGRNPKFSEWIAESPYRQSAAQRGIAGDWSATSELLHEFKIHESVSNASPIVTNGDDLEGARKASLESSASTGGGNSSDKVYKRSDLIRLKLEKPRIYEDPAFQEEIVRAYAEGRVK